MSYINNNDTFDILVKEKERMNNITFNESSYQGFIMRVSKIKLSQEQVRLLITNQ